MLVGIQSPTMPEARESLNFAKSSTFDSKRFTQKAGAFRKTLAAYLPSKTPFLGFAFLPAE